MKSLTFSCWICALNRGATKPIFCSKVAQKGKICSRLLEPQNVAPKAKSCSKVAEHNRETGQAASAGLSLWGLSTKKVQVKIVIDKSG